MSQAEVQEQSEREFLDRFPADRDQIATWAVERGAPLPFPDFVLRAQDRIVGVEVTEIYREPTGEGPLRQEIEVLRTLVLPRAQQSSITIPPPGASSIASHCPLPVSPKDLEALRERLQRYGVHLLRASS